MRRLNGLIFSCLVLLSCVGPASPISSSTSYTALLQARHGFGLFSCGALQCSPPDLCTCDGNHTHFLLDVTGDPASDAVVATLSCHNPRATPCTGPAQHNRFTVTPEDGLGIRFGRQIWLEQEAPRRTSFWDTSMVSDALTMDCPLYARLHVLEYNPVSEKACHNDPSVVLQACPILSPTATCCAPAPTPPSPSPPPQPDPPLSCHCPCSCPCLCPSPLIQLVPIPCPCTSARTPAPAAATAGAPAPASTPVPTSPGPYPRLCVLLPLLLHLPLHLLRSHGELALMSQKLGRLPDLQRLDCQHSSIA